MRPRRYRFVLQEDDLKYPDFRPDWDALSLQILGGELPNQRFLASDVLRILVQTAKEKGIADFKSHRSNDGMVFVTFTKRPRIGEKLRKAMKLD